MIKTFLIFSKGISPKVNVQARLELDLAYYNVEIVYISLSATGFSPTYNVNRNLYGNVFVLLCYVRSCDLLNSNTEKFQIGRSK